MSDEVPEYAYSEQQAALHVLSAAESDSDDEYQAAAPAPSAVPIPNCPIPSLPLWFPAR
jgi:hypothetical protein